MRQPVMVVVSHAIRQVRERGERQVSKRRLHVIDDVEECLLPIFGEIETTGQILKIGERQL